MGKDSLTFVFLMNSLTLMHICSSIPVAYAGYHMHLPVGLTPVRTGVFFCMEIANGCFAGWGGWLLLQPIYGRQLAAGTHIEDGARYIRRLLVIGRSSRMKQIISAPERFDPWFADLLDRNPKTPQALSRTISVRLRGWRLGSRNPSDGVVAALPRRHRNVPNQWSYSH